MGSYHTPIRVSFAKLSSTVMRAKQDKKIYYSKKQLEKAAKSLEKFVKVQLIKKWSHKELHELITRKLVGVTAHCQAKREKQ